MMNKNEKTNNGKSVLRYFLSVVSGLFATVATLAVIGAFAFDWLGLGMVVVPVMLGGWAGYSVLFYKLLARNKWFAK